ncbi:MAG: nitrite/sulfite reductase [Lachnospiraceae bacterium]
MEIRNDHNWKEDIPAFREKTAAFYAGELSKDAYKGFSGLYGSYAQKGGKASMLRLRMTGGCVTKEKLKFIADTIRTYNLKKAHFTTCQTIQLHDLDGSIVADIMEQAMDVGIITMGGGGDFPRNVTCSPLSGVEKDEYFNVLPWAKAAGEYLMGFIRAEKMPRKLKVAFSSSPSNLSHATYRDLGFAARPDGCFDVYSAGGLGNNPRFGVLIAEAVKPEDICYYIKAMWLTFRAYGNYENRGKARSRYMQESLGGAENYKKAFLEKLNEVYASGEDLKISTDSLPVLKRGDGRNIRSACSGTEAAGTLYCILASGGRTARSFCSVCFSDAIQSMDGVELRLAPDETAYVINLTAAEAERVLDITENNTAKTEFEASVSCIGAAVCQVGVRDSQSLLRACVEAVQKAGLPADALPKIHISGCPSSCGTHQTGVMGFRGAAKKVNGKAESAFLLFLNGCDIQGKEKWGKNWEPFWKVRFRTSCFLLVKLWLQQV